VRTLLLLATTTSAACAVQADDGGNSDSSDQAGQIQLTASSPSQTIQIRCDQKPGCYPTLEIDFGEPDLCSRLDCEGLADRTQTLTVQVDAIDGRKVAARPIVFSVLKSGGNYSMGQVTPDGFWAPAAGEPHIAILEDLLFGESMSVTIAKTSAVARIGLDAKPVNEAGPEYGNAVAEFRWKLAGGGTCSALAKDRALAMTFWDAAAGQGTGWDADCELGVARTGLLAAATYEVHMITTPEDPSAQGEERQVSAKRTVQITPGRFDLGEFEGDSSKL
jgi:hypothetical protein